MSRAKALGIKYYTNYEIFERLDNEEDRKIKRAFTRCKLFTSESIGYMSLMESKYRNFGITETFKLMKGFGNEKEFREMLLLDSLIYNVDRHKGNFGFLINNKNYDILQMAPIFDNNYAFLSRVSLKDEEEVERQLKIQRPKTMQDRNFIIQGKAAIGSSNDLRSRLYNLQDFKLDRRGIKYLEQERMDFMDKLIQNQVKAILKNC